MNREALEQALYAALAQENAEQTEALAREAVAQFPNEAFGYYYLAEAFWLQQNSDNAEICLVKALEFAPENTDYALRFAQMKEVQGEYADAEAMYRMILDKSPDCLPARLGLAFYYLHHENDEELALEQLDHALTVQPQHALARCLRAQAHLLAGHAQAALDDVEIALNNGAGEDGWLVKIAALSTLDRKAELEAAYRALLAAAPENPQYPIEFARFLQGEGRGAEALPFLDTLRQKNGGDPILWQLYSEILLEQEQYERAIAVIGEWIAADSGNWLARLYRAQALQSAGKTAEALADVKAAESSVTEASRPLLLREIARIALTAGDLREAGTRYQQLSKLEESKAEGYYGMGLVFQRAKQLDKAFECLQQAARLNHAPAQEHLHQYFSEYLQKSAAAMLERYASGFAKNQQTSALQPLFGKLWKYSAALNPLPDDLPQDIASELQARLSDLCMVITSRGIALVPPIDIRAQTAVYKIEQSSTTSATIEINPLDSSRPYSAQLSFKQANLHFQLKGSKSDPLVFQAVDPSAHKALLKKYFKADALDFLGEEAQSITTILK